MNIRIETLSSCSNKEAYSFRPTIEFVDFSFSSLICNSYSGDNEDYDETVFDWEDSL